MLQFTKNVSSFKQELAYQNAFLKEQSTANHKDGCKQAEEVHWKFSFEIEL